MNDLSNPFENETELNALNYDSNVDPGVFTLNQPDDEQRSLIEMISSIEKKDTNFIFLFGNPGTGKSYITASLIYYMKTSRLGDLRVAPSNSRDSELLIEDMYNDFHKGRILSRTNVLAPPYEIDLIFTPKDKRLPKMKITFLETSGENWRKVHINKGDTNSGRLPDNLDIYFMSGKIRPLFMLVSDHDTSFRDSLTINSFLDYVMNKDEKFEKANYLLAITKWDVYSGRHKRNVENFTKETMPNIHNRLINAGEGNAITHYSIGKIFKKEDNGVVSEQIKEVDLARAEAVTLWLYKTITKKSLLPKPTIWERIKSFF